MNPNFLNDYTIKSTIGQGTFSIVKLGINKLTGEKVAIKILEKKKIVKKEEVERVIREINILKNIKHLNLIKINQIKEDEERYYMIMEYCEKGELFNLIVKKRKLDENESAYYYYQLINGLEYIHSKHIAHRDLKPENLLINKSNILKIIDFGLSNFFIDNKYLATPCGSPCYASPEMVGGYKYDGYKIDVWSTGIILFAMLCGYLPFDDVNNDILFAKILRCKIDYPKFLGIHVLNLLKRILVTNPDKRITIPEIKLHPFYLKGKDIFNKIHPSIYENNICNNYYKKTLSNDINARKSVIHNRNYFYNNYLFNGTKYGQYINNTEGNKEDITHKNILTMNLEDFIFNNNSLLLKSKNIYSNNNNDNSSLNTNNNSKKKNFSPMMTSLINRKIQKNEKSVDCEPHIRNTSLNDKFLIEKKSLDITHSNRGNSGFGHNSRNLTDLTKSKDFKCLKKNKLIKKYDINVMDSNSNRNNREFRFNFDKVPNDIKNMNHSIEINRNKNNRKFDLNLWYENVNGNSILNRKNTNNVLYKKDQYNFKNVFESKNSSTITDPIINKIQALKNSNNDILTDGKMKSIDIHENIIKKFNNQLNENNNKNIMICENFDDSNARIHKKHHLEYLISELPSYKNLNPKKTIVNTSINLNNNILSNKIMDIKNIKNKEIKSNNPKNRKTKISINIKKGDKINNINPNFKLKSTNLDKIRSYIENKSANRRFIEIKYGSNDKSKKNSVTINNNNYNLNIYGPNFYLSPLINSNSNSNQYDRNIIDNNQKTNIIMKNNDFIKILKKTYVKNNDNDFLIKDNPNINSNINSNKYIKQKRMSNKNINSDSYTYISNKSNTIEPNNYLINSAIINSNNNRISKEYKYGNITKNYNIDYFPKKLMAKALLSNSKLHGKTEKKADLQNNIDNFDNINIKKNENIPFINIINTKKELEECFKNKKFFEKNRNKIKAYEYEPLNSTGNYIENVMNIKNDRDTDKKGEGKMYLAQNFEKIKSNRYNFEKKRKLGME